MEQKSQNESQTNFTKKYFAEVIGKECSVEEAIAIRKNLIEFFNLLISWQEGK